MINSEIRLSINAAYLYWAAAFRDASVYDWSEEDECQFYRIKGAVKYLIRRNQRRRGV